MEHFTFIVFLCLSYSSKLESENIPEYDPSKTAVNLWVVSGERLRRPETQPYGERESDSDIDEFDNEDLDDIALEKLLQN